MWRVFLLPLLSAIAEKRPKTRYKNPGKTKKACEEICREQGAPKKKNKKRRAYLPAFFWGIF
jgi:hypothetical protein